MSTLVSRIEFYSAADGRRLAARVWSSEQGAGSGEQEIVRAPRGHVVFLHGITSHGGWYARSCRHLVDAGFDVHLLDRRGSGLNPHDRGDVDRCETWLSDVELYLRNIRSHPLHVAAPTVLCGISWGGKLAVAVAHRHPDLVQGLALICPGLYSYQQPGFVKRAVLSGPLPARMQARRVPIPLADPRLFTDSPRWVDFVADDPLSLRRITIRFAQADLELTRAARQSVSFSQVSMLLMLSGRDRIVQNQRTRAYFSRVAARSKTLIEYPDAAHTLEFEPDPRPYFHDLTEWMKGVSK